MTLETFLALDLTPYAAVLVLVVMALLFAGFNLAITHVLGPRVRGQTKDIVPTGFQRCCFFGNCSGG